MKNRYVGIITVTFPDGYVERCLIRQKTNKGSQEFLSTIKEYTEKIFSEIPPDQKGRVTFKYKGDFYKEIYEHLQRVLGERNGKSQLQTA